jgi:hypothetical protein
VRSPTALAAAGLLLLNACGLVQVARPDAGAIPAGQPEAMAGAPDPIGPVMEVGHGRSFGVGWRAVAYESADGVCTQLELGDGLTGGACGPLPGGETVFGAIGSGQSNSGLTTVDGVVAGGVASVTVRIVDGGNVEATMMPLDPAGLDGAAFVGFAPAGSVVDSVIALDEDGDLIETFDLGGQ